MKQHLTFALAVVLLAGCGGGGGGSSSVPGSNKTQGKTVTGSVVISIPTTAQTSSAKVRYPQFVSPAAASVAMSVNGSTDAFFDVSSTSSLCTTTAGTRNCTLTFGAPAGSDAFSFLIFSGPNGTGTQLAVANLTQAILAGQAFNFTVALNAAVGVIIPNLTLVTNQGSMQCPDGPNSFNGINEGCAGSAPLQLTVEDPSGAQITGTAAYATPITITGNDPSLSATPSQFTAPGQTVQLGYTGAPFASTITNTVVATITAGGQNASLTIPVLRQYLYVAHSNAPVGTAPPGNGNITVYTFGASGSTLPVRTLAGVATGITTPIKPLVDSSGVLYVLDNNIPVSTTFNPTIRVFLPGANGNVAPNRTIMNIGSVSGNSACSDMTFDPTGNFLFVTCGLDFFVFPVAFSGNVNATSAVTASFEDDSGSTSNGLAFDLGGNLYMSDSNLNQIRIYSAPVTTSGGFHLIGATGSMDGGSAWNAGVKPFFLTTDNSGALFAPIWFQNATGGGADSFAELAIWNSGNICNNCNPNAFLTNSPFTTHAVDGITLDSAGNLYVDNMFTNVVTEFARSTITGASLGTTGTVLRTLTNNSTGIAGSTGMAIGP